MALWTTSLSEAAVDFNAVRAEGTLGVSRRFLRGLIPSPGDEIQLYDIEGNRCIGTVEEVRDRSLQVRLLWESWIPSPEEPFVTGSTLAAGATIQRTSFSMSSDLTLSSLERSDGDEATGVTSGLPDRVTVAA